MRELKEGERGEPGAMRMAERAVIESRREMEGVSAAFLTGSSAGLLRS